MKNIITILLTICSLFSSFFIPQDGSVEKEINNTTVPVVEETTTEVITEKETEEIKTIEKITEKATEVSAKREEVVGEKVKEKIKDAPTTTKPVIKETTTAATTQKIIASVPKYNSGKTEKDILKLINKNRNQNNINDLVMDETLCGLAAVRACEASKKWSHERPNGTRFYTVFSDYNVRITKVGENLAKGSLDPETLVNAWMNSDSHKENILNGEYTKTGIAIYRTATGNVFIAQLFQK